jgi:two-component system, NarL family, sensor histidine kinase DevS
MSDTPAGPDGVPSSSGRPSRSMGGPTGDHPALTFPDVPRMALEELIGRLTEQAQEVLAAQGRLRALIRANALVSGELNLQLVLRHIVAAAKDLVQARYAALGVLDDNGLLQEFIHVGMPDDVVDAIGALPTGRGVLGLLISRPEPIRIADLGAHRDSVGFPAQHPPMRSFLGVPIRARGRVFGNLYLTESERGEFTAEDEQLVVALAASAGTAIDNARLFQQSEQRRQWLAASADVTQRLLARPKEPPMELVLRYAAQGASADVASVVLPAEEGSWTVQVAVGEQAQGLVGHAVDLDHSIAGRVIQSGKPVLSTDFSMDFPDSVPLVEIGSAIGAPLVDDDSQVLGAITVARRLGLHAFTAEDRDQLAAFTSHVGVAMALDQARSDHETMRLIEDHDRIAADLHDHVIQQLFAVGMGLQGILRTLPRKEQQERIHDYVDALDATITRIRMTIFQLRVDQSADSLQRRLLAVIEEETPVLGFFPDIRVTGPLDLGVGRDLADDVVAVVREALSNVGRHAAASSVAVEVSLVHGMVTVDVCDDGRGIENPTRSSGLTNLRRRAEAQDGSFHLSRSPQGGTRLRWSARAESGSDTFDTRL